MRRTATEIIRNLEMRIARLERQASMRTADMNDYDDAFNEADRDSKIDAGKLRNGDMAVVAEASDMVSFLYSMGYRVSPRERERSLKLERGKLFILGSDHEHSRNKGHLFVVDENEVRKPPRKRSGYNFYR